MPERKGRRALAALAATLLAASALAGCSAANMTGFDFPAFGLLKKSDSETRDADGADMPPAAEDLGAQ